MTRIRRRKRVKKSAKSHWPTTLARVGSMASAAFNIASTVASMINVEQKYVDYSINAQPYLANGVRYFINAVAQGTDNTQRIGRSIRVKNIQLKFNVALPAAVSTSEVVKWILVCDKKHAGALMNISPDYLVTQDEIDFRNVDFGSRFVTIKSGTINLSPTGSRIRHVDQFIDLDKFKSINHTEYDGTTNAIGDCSANPIYIIFVSSAPTAGTVDIRGRSRIRFVDN